MKTRTTLLVLFAALLFIGTSCEKSIFPIRGNGDVATETRSVSGFNKVENEGQFDVYIIQSDEYSVTIEAESNLIGRIRTRMNGSILEIDTKDNLKPSSPMKLYIYTPDMNGVKLSGSGIIDLGEVITDELDVRLSGSGDIRGSVDADDVYIGISGSGTANLSMYCNTIETDVSGSGDMYFNGMANTAYFNISGSGAVRAYDFELQKCSAKISGSGDMFVNVSEHLNVTISGSGSVYYIGYPSINTNISGSGNVISKN